MLKSPGLGRGSGMTHHSIMTYQERLANYIEVLATDASTVMQGEDAAVSANMTSLFRPPSAADSSPSQDAHQAALDSIGRAAGTAAQVSQMLMSYR